MAEMQIKAGKATPRVDLTPMVDLGFLLITFFMFTTTMTKPNAMELQMPYKEDHMGPKTISLVKESTAMTILLSKDHRIYYYYGIGSDPVRPPVLQVSGFKELDGIRDAIIAKKKMVQDLIARGSDNLDATDKLTIIVKPAANSSTDDLINILDEMTINSVPIYAVVDISPVDLAFIAATEKENGIQ
ncbi:biopolymer transporter ExbD [Taibaiella sp. KBW10]|uniref:biopolymer transporter ExbD n=1 Tax=Taibaiella sp. KBW10 TaxID=2153357 RepID=UPI000F5A88DE|nr:biopolymer transporter ExbD [Taibaiella sp. KBW10]RQO31962.1 biopolymer transporter ExbD [Taibaiella sp. KBW10]